MDFEGNGTVAIIYDPDALNPSGGFNGTRGIVAGTWKDWDEG